MPRIVIALIVLATIFILFTLIEQGRVADFFIKEAEKPYVIFNDKTPLRVTVVESLSERQRGLSGYPSLGPTEGMLFVFSEDEYHGFWMKEMNFPIDIIWIDKDGTVVSVEHAAQPDSYPRVFEPTGPARYVVETNAYFAETYGIAPGSTVTLPKALR